MYSEKYIQRKQYMKCEKGKERKRQKKEIGNTVTENMNERERERDCDLQFEWLERINYRKKGIMVWPYRRLIRII